MEHLVSGADEDRLRFAFQLYDVDEAGTINNHTLDRLIEASMVENDLVFSQEQVSHLVKALLREADTDKNGSFAFDEFKQLIEVHPD